MDIAFSSSPSIIAFLNCLTGDDPKIMIPYNYSNFILLFLYIHTDASENFSCSVECLTQAL